MESKYRCTQVRTKKDIRDFISLPFAIYEKKFLPRQKTLEKQILTGRHVLSGDFEATGFLVRKKEGNGRHKVLCRCILTFYENDERAYVGFFESFDDLRAVRLLFRHVRQEAGARGRTKLTGPVDCSFWIRYRFKMDHFRETYTGEPCNPPYYAELWKAAGFRIKEKYYSSRLRVPDQREPGTKYKSRLRAARERGYEFRNTDGKKFRQDLEDIYELIVRLYANFPAYKPIRREQFMTMFRYMKWILNYEMVFLAYKDRRLAGFLICLPNYKSMHGLRSLLTKAGEYVILYMGVDEGDYGLGGAFSELCREYLERHRSTSIAALIHEGNVSGTFYKSLCVDRFHYALMECELGEMCNC